MLQRPMALLLCISANKGICTLRLHLWNRKCGFDEVYCNGYTYWWLIHVHIWMISLWETIPKFAICQSIYLLIGRIEFKWLGRSISLCLRNSRDKFPVGVSVLLSLVMAGNIRTVGGKQKCHWGISDIILTKNKQLYNKINWAQVWVFIWTATAGRKEGVKYLLSHILTSCPFHPP